jgi:hypothetical protein
MSETLTVDPGSSMVSTLAHRAGDDDAHERRCEPVSAKSTTLPSIRPGQVWVVEPLTAGAHLSPLGHRAVSSADVVIYDRALYPIVAATLPLGGYAEPASSEDNSPDKTIDRCIQFARDGWSVVWLVDRAPSRDARVDWVGRQLAHRLIGAGSPASQSVAPLGNGAGDALETTETSFCRFGDALDGANSERSLVIAFPAVSAKAAARLHPVSSNGLAG